MTEEKRLSTTQLAKEHGIPQEQLFALLSSQGLIEKVDDKWTLTEAGEKRGGVYQTGKYGQYVAWPLNFEVQVQSTKTDAPKLLTATALGQHFELSANKINYVLSELGWIKKGLKGWVVTEQGKKIGAEQGEDSRSGIPYARWPEKVLKIRALKDSPGSRYFCERFFRAPARKISKNYATAYASGGPDSSCGTRLDPIKGLNFVPQ